MREALPIAIAMSAALEAAATPPAAVDDNAGSPASARGARRSAKGAAGTRPAPTATGDEPATDVPDEEPVEPAVGRAIPAPLRRKAAEILVSVWIDVARDLALAGSGGLASVRDPDLIEELSAAAADLPDGAAAAALATTERAAMLLAANASPELVLDVLVLDWPRRRRAA